MRNIINQLKIAILMVVIMTIVTGIIYPATVTVIARFLFPYCAGGSLVVKDNHVIGSKLIGQNFTSPKYFHPRPSLVDYNAAASGGSNLAPTSFKLISKITVLAKLLHEDNPTSKIPVDLATASASGLDPHITPEAAEFQIPRVSKFRGVSQQRLHELVVKYTEGRQFGLFGEPRVNVLVLNLALDELTAHVK